MFLQDLVRERSAGEFLSAGKERKEEKKTTER